MLKYHIVTQHDIDQCRQHDPGKNLLMMICYMMIISNTGRTASWPIKRRRVKRKHHENQGQPDPNHHIEPAGGVAQPGHWWLPPPPNHPPSTHPRHLQTAAYIQVGEDVWQDQACFALDYSANWSRLIDSPAFLYQKVMTSCLKQYNTFIITEKN